MLKGLPASGKSTWAAEKLLSSSGEIVRVNKDDLRRMLNAGQHSKAKEVFVCSVRDFIVQSALDAGKSVIVDDTNLEKKHEIRLREIAGGRNFEIIDFTHVSLAVCLERDLKRVRSVGEKVIRGMWRKYLKEEYPPPEHNPHLPNAVICDLDGTLCWLNGRSPYDASECDKDLLNPVVAELIKDKWVILVSGREEKFRAPTEVFLKKHGIKHYGLFMRPTGDFREDSIVKEEIYRKEILEKVNVKFVLDDRDRVVEMWRRLGLTCLQVAEGNF